MSSVEEDFQQKGLQPVGRQPSNSEFLCQTILNVLFELLILTLFIFSDFRDASKATIWDFLANKGIRVDSEGCLEVLYGCKWLEISRKMTIRRSVSSVGPLMFRFSTQNSTH